MEDVFPSDYNKQESPPGAPRKPNPLYIGLNVIDIDRIEESSMEFSIRAYLREIWMDRRLNLSSFIPKKDVANFGLPNSVVDRLWTPDIVFDNVKSGALFSLSVPNRYVLVLRTGHFYRATRYNLIVECYMNFMYYPLDIQECHLKISLLQTPDRKLQLHWVDEHSVYKHYFKGVSFDSVIRPLKFELRPPKVYQTIELYAKENYTFLYANFTFVRKLSGSIFNVYIPSTLVVCLSWTSFWIDVGAVPARITLGVTSFLTLVTQMIQARNSLPAISYMTAIDIWLFVCLFKVFCSILVYAFTYRLYIVNNKDMKSNSRKTSHESTKPKARSNLRLGNSQSLPSDQKVFSSRKPNNELKKSGKSQKSCLDPQSIDKFSRIIFPLLFVIFASTYWAYFLRYT